MSLLLLLLLQTSAPVPTRLIVHATREDCAVIVAIGREKAAWGRKGPDQPFAVDGVQPDGSVYREDCDWAAAGVGPPAPMTQHPGAQGFAVDKPIYAADGATATAELTFTALGEKAGVSPFLSVQTCTVRKKKGRWKLRACKETLIT